MNQILTEEENENLQKKVLDTLDKYNNINELFRNKLIKEFRDEFWFCSPLVILLLYCGNDQLEIFNDSFKETRKEKDLFEGFKQKINQRETGTFILHDIFAEIRGYKYLKKNGYEAIKLIQQSNNKTPDFEAINKGKKSFIEVKNIRNANPIVDYILHGIDGYSFTGRKISETLCTAIVSNYEDNSINLNARNERCVFFKKLFDTIDNYFKTLEEEKSRKSEMHIDYNCSNSDFSVSTTLITNPITDEINNNHIKSITKRFSRKIKESIDQIESYAKDNQISENDYYRNIIIHWENRKIGEYIDCSEEIDNSINNVTSMFNSSNNSNIEVIYLNKWEKENL